MPALKVLRQGLVRLLVLWLVALVGVQLYFVARIALMAVIAPESSAFERSEIYRITQTTGSFMNAKSLCVGPDAGDRCAVVVSKWALCQSRIIKTKAYTQAAARNAWRQPQRAVVNVKKIGAKAQPRLPVNPCTLNA